MWGINCISSTKGLKVSFLISNCHYCGTKKIRFDNKGFNKVSSYRWDIFAVCSQCHNPTVFHVQTKTGIDTATYMFLSNAKDLADLKTMNLSLGFEIVKIKSPPNSEIVPCPEYVPDKLKAVFDEAAICLSMNCHTASAAMFRLCLDLTTKELLQEWTEANKDLPNQPNSAQRGNLANRIDFLINSGAISMDLKDYAHHIRLDGNEAAHEGSTEKQDAEDLLDFTELLLKRIYTTRKQLELAQERRLARRSRS